MPQLKQRGYRFPDEINERIVAIARKEGNPASSVVRRILAAGLDREEGREVETTRPKARRTA